MMKKLIFPLLSFVLLTALPLTFSVAMPQSDGQDISVRGTEVVLNDNSTVRVSFRIELGDRVTAPNRSLIIVPLLRGTGGEHELPPIIVRGERARPEIENQVVEARGIDLRGRYLTSNGKTIDYRVTIPWQDWMDGSQLILNGFNAGRDRATEVEIGRVAHGLLAGQGTPAVDYAAPLPDITPTLPPPSPAPAPPPPFTPVQTQQPEPEPVYNPAPYTPAPVYYSQAGTIGDELAARFTFVEPAAKYNEMNRNSVIDETFDYNMPLLFGTGATGKENEADRFIEMTRSGALYIEFEKGSNAINRDLSENNQKLVDLISSIRILDASPDTRVVQVVVVGFSAPEGALDEKETLAMERAKATRDFLTANSRVDPSAIGVYNGAVDWTTLRILVSDSNMPEKYKILDIIDNVPTWGNIRNKGRLAQLIALNNGEEIRYMREIFFPQLRQTGAYIKVYYENTR